MEFVAARGVEAREGEPYPLGATVKEQGVNFSLYSKDATRVTLLLFDSPDATVPVHVFDFDPMHHKRGHYWFMFVTNIGHGQVYAFQVDGPWVPEHGLRFDQDKVLLDPYCQAISIGRHYCREKAIGPGSNMGSSLLSMVVDQRVFDWQGTCSPRHSLKDTMIYELHVGGFTKHPSSGVEEARRGTFAGIIDKIPYLKSLGVTAVELMPVQQFDIYDAPDGRSNYWGYSPINFFAIHADYSVDKDPLAAINEFKTLVRELHKAGIEVILDVGLQPYCRRGSQRSDILLQGAAERRLLPGEQKKWQVCQLQRLR